MKRILELDKQLTSLFSNFQSIANELEFRHICLLADEETIATQNYSGIYRIDTSTNGQAVDAMSWIKAFQAEWEHEDFKKKHTPNLIKKRIDRHKHLQLPEWMPLYMG